MLSLQQYLPPFKIRQASVVQSTGQKAESHSVTAVSQLQLTTGKIEIWK